MKNNKMRTITLRYWTNDLDLIRNGKPVKACWDSGKATLEANEELKIPELEEFFNCEEDVPKIIRKLLKKAKIHLVCNNKKPQF